MMMMMMVTLQLACNELRLLYTLLSWLLN